jgi:hypothetical protein
MLIVGPLLVGLGFALLAAFSGMRSYWTGVLPGLSVVALGMGIAVAPLTDTVLEAVADEYEGAAAGINNAVARVAGLLAVALVGFVVGGADARSVAAGYREAMIAAAAASVLAALIAALTIHTAAKTKSR